MTIRSGHMPLFLILTLACSSAAPQPAAEPQGQGSTLTGIEGTVSRGPTRPVCRTDQPCNAPFSASFEVLQGDQVVARFHTDSAGRFQIHLPPGTYTIVPDSSVGILIRSQVHKVTVGSKGLTRVGLEFDTGIR